MLRGRGRDLVSHLNLVNDYGCRKVAQSGEG